MIKLEEGKIYPFKIDGEMELPNGNICFKLTDPNGIRHVLVKSDYENYNLKTGDKVRCHIDKLNCSGQLFFEPLHPYYEIGKCYEFPFIRSVIFKDASGKMGKKAIIRDALGQETSVPIEDIPADCQPGDLVKFKIDLVKKGRIYLWPCQDEDFLSALIPGKILNLTLKGTKTYNGSREFYDFQDDNGRRFFIRKKFYTKYGFDIGDRVKCEVKEKSGVKFLEPLHPVFRKNMYFDFEILSEETVTIYPGRKVKVYNLKNPYGKSIVIEKGLIKPGGIHQNRIRCKVIDVVQSTPVIECN